MSEINKPDYSYLWSSGGAKVAPSNVKIQTGWTAEVPPFQWENWSQNRQDQAIAHILQHGISVWDALTEYQAGKSYVQGSDGLLYLARTTNTGNNPVADVSFVNWTKFASGSLLATRTITTNGLVVPTPGTKFWRVRGIGGGGGSGGTNATSASQSAASSGGASGSFFETLLTAAQIGAGLVATIGNGGAAASPNGNGVAGGNTLLGGLIVAPGGGGGNVGAPVATTATAATIGGAPGGVTTGATVFNSDGNQGGQALVITTSVLTGVGGGSSFGAGGRQSIGGAAGTGYGSGASGVGSNPSSAAKGGIAGQPGVLFIEEFS